ncbi:MAG TPA: short-chain fatty acyl-CoA regulator family protein [Polyangiaceae bacterium]|nr:short-chain fatty acyl-CoA regulator family protein [Polyangiaceae bacterium]
MKSFLGPRLRRLREERGITQVALANLLGVSSSYYNQLENDQRPVTSALREKIGEALQVDVRYLSDEENERLTTDVRETLSASRPEVSFRAPEIAEFVQRHPEIARTLVELGERHRAAVDRSRAIQQENVDASAALAEGTTLAPHEEVRDYFYERHNYIHSVDSFAERIAETLALRPGEIVASLEQRLRSVHGVEVVTSNGSEALEPHRRYEPGPRRLVLPLRLLPGQRAFQLATQLAFLEAGQVLDEALAEGRFSSPSASALARIGLANHFAGALLMPYAAFFEAAETLRYDVDRLRQQFRLGFETICHRLSTLQRPGKTGVPFFFLRVDRAGNISKRQSASDFHFSKVGGTCPLWNVYEAFSQPGRILRQIAEMPDGRTYLWIARAATRSSGGFGAPDKIFSIALGCDVRHAHRLVYSNGLDLRDARAATPIGMGCKVCERKRCPQRAFPPLTRTLVVTEDQSAFEPYPFA